MLAKTCFSSISDCFCCYCFFNTPGVDNLCFGKNVNFNFDTFSVCPYNFIFAWKRKFCIKFDALCLEKWFINVVVSPYLLSYPWKWQSIRLDWLLSSTDMVLFHTATATIVYSLRTIIYLLTLLPIAVTCATISTSCCCELSMTSPVSSAKNWWKFGSMDEKAFPVAPELTSFCNVVHHIIVILGLYMGVRHLILLFNTCL